MSADDETLRDLTTRTRQLEAHLLRSPEYLFKADQGFKRQVSMLYLAVALLFVFQGFFLLLHGSHMPPWLMGLICFTSGLAIVNCFLLIRTKRYLHRLNERWLTAESRRALEALRRQEAEIRGKAPAPSVVHHPEDPGIGAF